MKRRNTQFFQSFRGLAVKLGISLLMGSFALVPQAGAFELSDGVNQASVVYFPTALTQPQDHLIAVASEVTDVVNPEMHLSNLRYGYQYGAFQLLTDLFYTIEPVREFNYAEIKGKLQVLGLDEYRFYMALGLLGRGVSNSEEREWRIDNRSSSFFGAISVELFPFDDWGGILTNLYLDNRYFSLGLKIQVFEGIQGVFEVDRLHSSEYVEEKTHGRGGVSFEQLENFFLQLLYDDQGENFLIQMGVGF